MNNYTNTSIDEIRAKFNSSRYIVIGKEVGDSGTPHLQGFIQLDKRMSMKKIGSAFRWHTETTKGTPEQAANYCKKDGDYVEFGELSTPSSGKVKKDDRWKRILSLAAESNMSQIAEEYPGEYVRNFRNLHNVRVEHMPSDGRIKTCIWLYGKPGTGKSRFAFGLNPTSTYAKMANKWWDGYKDQKTIILDDFGKDHKCLGYHLKRWSDRYPSILEVKGTAIPTTYDHLVITSNYSIDEIWCDDTEMCAAINRRFTTYEVFDHQIDLEGLLSIMTIIDNKKRLINIHEVLKQ